jgi:hypothetical protein
MKATEAVLANDMEVLKFLKERLPIFHLSNIFFRDIQFGIQSYLKAHAIAVSYTSAEEIARKFVAKLEKEKVLRPIDRQTWMVQYEGFRTPVVKAAAPVAKAATAAPPAQASAATPA